MTDPELNETNSEPKIVQWRDTKAGFAIAYDEEGGRVLVAQNVNPFPGGRPMWEQRGQFKNPEQWTESPYSKQLDESTQETIIYFWLDNENNEQVK